MTDRLVQVDDLHVRFPDLGVHAVRGVSFHVDRGEVLAVVGESGSGKSVTARTLLGMSGAGADVTAARLEVAGEDVSAFTEAQWRRFRGRSAGLVAQDALVSLDPLRPVGTEVTEAPFVHRLIRRSERAARAEEVLERVGVPDAAERARQYPHELSGGLRQRALIGSGIAAEPGLVILDEPTTALDVTTQARVLAMLGEMRDARDVGMLFISHDLTVVAALADRVLVMRDGVIVEAGPVEEVLTDPRHPYTRRLLDSVPAGRPKGTRLLSDAARPARASVTVGSDEVVLRATALTKRYARPGGGERIAARDVSFELRRGRTLGIVGESGSGKTTVSRMALALTAPSEGTVELFGGAWSALPLRRRQPLRRRIQVIAQDPLSSFDPRYTVARLLAEPLRLHRRLGRSDVRAESERLLAEVGLDAALLSRRPLQLSGGQRQRLAIARALAPEPEVLVCDEPVSALDVSVQAQVLDLLSELQEQRGLSMLFISHDLGVIEHMSDDILVMKDGDVVEAGAAASVIGDPQHAYTRELLTALPRVGEAS